MSSKKIFAANWKLHKNPSQTREFFKNFLSEAGNACGNSESEIYFFPSATSLEAASQSLKDSPIKFGSQNCYSLSQGAFTGEISAQVVKDIGGHSVLIGHSERRKIFGEVDQLIADKVAHVQSLDLTPLFCIGETLEERESNKVKQVLETQIRIGLSKANSSKSLIVAYEPVWAIGTGKIASSAQVKETHQLVYDLLKSFGFEKSAILYGGSVKPDNSKELLQIPHVDGFLVGGASLEPLSFLAIARS